MAAYVVLFLLLAVGIALRVQYLPVPSRTPDEYAYTFVAGTIEQGGLQTMPGLVREYMARPELQVYPRPTRFDFPALGAVAMWLSGDRSPQAVAWVSTLASVLLMLVILRLGLRFLGPWSTVIALAFVIASPLDLAMARRAWGDELLALLALAMLYALLRQHAEPKRWWWAVACLGLGALSLSIKETGVLFLGLAALGLAWSAYRSAGWKGSALALGAGALALAVGVGALAAACGGIDALSAAVLGVAQAASTDEYLLKYQTGGAMYYVRGLGILQPIPMLLGFLAAVLVMFRAPFARATAARPHRFAALLALSVFVLVFTAVGVAYSQKNMRFVSALYAPLYLMAGALVQGIVAALTRRGSTTRARVTLAALVALLALSVLADRACFERWFIRRQVPDLATPWFTGPPPAARPAASPGAPSR